MKREIKDNESLRDSNSIGSFFIKSSYISDFSEHSQNLTASLMT